MVLGLVHDIADECAAQAELARTLLAAVRNVIDEQEDVQRDLRRLQKQIDRLAATHGAPAIPAPKLERVEANLDGHRALREQTRQTRRRSRELAARTAELSDRADMLMDDLRAITVDLPTPATRRSQR